MAKQTSHSDQENPKTFKPYISASTILPELQVGPILLGCVLGIIFGAASLYLALRVGMTVSASIPVAVMSISIFRWLSKAMKSRPATILENNMVQTVGSAGESVAFGVAVTMPALFILGYDMDLTRSIVVAVLGGLLGILMMIPLRRGLIVKEHGKLMYPEGTACAEVLIAGEKGGTNAKTVFSGFGLGLIYKLFTGEGSFSLLKNTFSKPISFFKGALFETEVSPELLGVGYIIGPRIAWITFGGGVLAYLVLIPAIHLFGDLLTEPLFPATKLIKDMSPSQIRNNYVLYIGAGAVAAGGIISMIRVLPTIVGAFIAGFKDLLGGQKTKKSTVERTDEDLPMSVVVLGSLALVAALVLTPSLHLNVFSAVLIIAFGFLFVTVSSRLTGEIGSSSNPISGMTVATLLLTCLIFLTLGKTSSAEKVSALMIAAIVCVASSNGGTISQDLKTGYLVGATPKYQQIGILFGAMTSALVIGYTIQMFNNSATIFAKRDYPSVVVSQDQFVGQQKLFGPEAKYDAETYNKVFFTAENAPKDETGKYLIEPGKYLATNEGVIKYLVDPGINGVLTHRDLLPGQTEAIEVPKYDAPKARLMSLIIDGILTRKLPWGLVLLGVFIALTLELCGVPSLAFAVGVYLPISTTAPIGLGGLIRYLVERKQKPASETEGDSSPGVLFSSGLIAGGAIAGMVLAIIAGSSESFAQTMNLGKFIPSISESNLITMACFLGLSYVVYLVGRAKILK